MLGMHADKKNISKTTTAAKHEFDSDKHSFSTDRKRVRSHSTSAKTVFNFYEP